MAKKYSDHPKQSSKRNDFPDLLSESKSDDEMRYNPPHDATPPDRDLSDRKGPPGAPEKPIGIPDTQEAGTLDEPIWISDVDGTDTETDTSVAAVRGSRKPRLATKVPPSSAFRSDTRPRSKSRERKATTRKNVALSSEDERPVPKRSSPAHKKSPVPSSEDPKSPAPKSPPREIKSKSSSSTSSSQDRKLKNVISAASEDTPTTSNHLAKMESSYKPPINNPFDIDSLASEGDDPMLEKELEEIALTGRSGMISGTPGVVDVEKGSNNDSSSSFPLTASLAEDDEADRSWHNPFLHDKPRRNKRQRWYLLLSVVVFIIIVSSLISVRSDHKKPPKAQTFDPNLTARQKAMDNILLRVTDAAILSNPKTPQYKARHWILFSDKVLKSVQEDQVIQRYVLACFYFSTGGNIKWNSNNWLIGEECGGTPWNGLVCNANGEVQALDLDNAGLTGTMPLELGHVTRLESLILKNNPGLFGWIPTTLAHIKSLSQLGLYENALSGTIPDIFKHANQIRYINLEGNNMYGSIPLSIQQLTKLDTLALANNRFDGRIPISELSQTALKYLSLSQNEFSSMLEHSIKTVTTLEYLYLDHNKLRGPIPREIAALTNLRSLDLGSNQLTGTIPTELGGLQRLEFLAMDKNQLKGFLPSQLVSLTNMIALNFASNQLVGTLPDVSSMTRLVNLQLFENKLTGSIPHSLQHLTYLEILFLSSNKLTGTVPRTISYLSGTLRGLYLSDNQIQGRIPTELCQFSHIEALFLDTNKLFGPIPSCLGNLSQLQQLYLFQNQLTGQVPSTFGQLQELHGLGLEQNDLTGTISGGVCTLVDKFSLDIWADCKSTSHPLQCNCCSVCCPSANCQ